MMKILLSYGCNANSSDTQGKTPFSILVNKLQNLKNGNEILKYFRDHASDQRRKSKLTKVVTAFEDEEIFDVSFLNLKDLLRNGDINKFEDKFPQLKGSHQAYKSNCEDFLEIAIESRLINIIDLIVNSASSKNINDLRLEENNSKIPLLFWAYKEADLEVFSIFLLNPHISLHFGSSTLFHYFFEKIKIYSSKDSKESDEYQWTSEMTPNEKKCFDLIPRCDRDYLNKLDEDGYPAIYYSVKYGVDYMTRRLLEEGAYIGSVITNIRRSLLSDFLDSCITSNSKFQDDKDFKLTVDYKFLKPSSINNKYGMNQIAINISNSSVEKFHPFSVKEHHDNYDCEMISLRKLVGNANLQRLIMHPVLASFVFLKWSKIRFLIHLNLILTLLYIFSFIPFVLINEHRTTSNNNCSNLIYKPLYVASFLSITVLILRELSQLILSPKRYILSRSNWIDIALILASLAILLDFWSRNHHLRMLHTIIILLAMWEYFNLLGYLPLLSVSLHTKIFRKVFTTFFKSLAFYSVMIIGFALAFYTLQGDKFVRDSNNSFINPQDANETRTLNLTCKFVRNYTKSSCIHNEDSSDIRNISFGSIPTNQTRAERYNNFYTVGHSIVKSFVMLTGELEASNIQLEGITYSALFLLFLFIVTIVLQNLLNALAVSDTHEIKVDAKLIDLQQRVLTMHQSEKAIFEGFVGERYHGIGVYLKKFMSMFSETLKEDKISFQPNKNRYINGDRKSELKLNEDIILTCVLFC
ncbi:hypothetical protein ACKWTF_013198 [Chironomus riparius]